MGSQKSGVRKLLHKFPFIEKTLLSFYFLHIKKVRQAVSKEEIILSPAADEIYLKLKRAVAQHNETTVLQ